MFLYWTKGFLFLLFRIFILRNDCIVLGLFRHFLLEPKFSQTVKNFINSLILLKNGWLYILELKLGGHPRETPNRVNIPLQKIRNISIFSILQIFLRHHDQPPLGNQFYCPPKLLVPEIIHFFKLNNCSLAIQKLMITRKAGWWWTENYYFENKIPDYSHCHWFREAIFGHYQMLFD